MDNEELLECPRCGSRTGLMPSEGMCEMCYNELCERGEEIQEEMLETLRALGN